MTDWAKKYASTLSMMPDRAATSLEVGDLRALIDELTEARGQLAYLGKPSSVCAHVEPRGGCVSCFNRRLARAEDELAEARRERDALVVARDAAQAEVEKGNAGARLLTGRWEAALATARAVAAEEFARVADKGMCLLVGKTIRALAPLEASLVAVPKTQMRGLLEYAHQHGAAGFHEAWGPVFAALGMEPL